MSQRNVERVIGQLVTDESFRRRFAGDPVVAVQELIDCGVALSECERRALTTLDLGHFNRFAETLDPCILKADLKGDLSCDN